MLKADIEMVQAMVDGVAKFDSEPLEKKIKALELRVKELESKTTKFK